MKTERRRHFDPTQRATYAACTVRDNCELVRVGSLKHAYLVFMKFEQLDVDGDCALMRCPDGWADGSVVA